MEFLIFPFQGSVLSEREPNQYEDAKDDIFYEIQDMLAAKSPKASGKPYEQAWETASNDILADAYRSIYECPSTEEGIE